MCSSAFNPISIASERKVFTEVKIALGCSKNWVRFVHPKEKTLATSQEDQPRVDMVTCELSSDSKFYVTANMNDHASIFVLREFNSDEIKRENDNEGMRIVQITDYVRSVPVLLHYR